MASAVASYGNKLKSVSKKLTNLNDLLNTSRDLINSYVESANASTKQSEYSSYVDKFDAEKENFDKLLTEYKELGGEYSDKVEMYNDLVFSHKAKTVTYDLPNPKDKYQWMAGGVFYNEKNAGGYAWSATNPLAPDEKPDSKDLGLVINRGSIHPYLNEGFTEVQNELRGFEFLDLLGDYKDTQVVSYEVTLTVVTNDGSTLNFSNTFDDTSGIGDNNFNNMAQSNMSVDAITNIMSTPGMDLMSLNAIGLAQYTVTSMINGKTFSSPKDQIGNMIAASLMNTVKNVAAQKTTLAISRALGIKSVVALGIVNIGVGMVIGELAEMAIGYDNHFGFGGEFAGLDQNGKATYGRAKSISQGLKEMVPDAIRGMLGLDFTTEDMFSKMEQDVNNNFGLTNQQGITSLYNYDTFTDATTNLSLSESIANSQGFADTMAQAQIDAQTMSDQLGAFNDTSFGGGDGGDGGGMDMGDGGFDGGNNGGNAGLGGNGTGFG